MRIWHTTTTAAEHAGYHPDTVRKACESGELHASQRGTGCHWRIHHDCLDSWAGGEACPRHAQAGAA